MIPSVRVCKRTKLQDLGIWNLSGMKLLNNRYAHRKCVFGVPYLVYELLDRSSTWTWTIPYTVVFFYEFVQHWRWCGTDRRLFSTGFSDLPHVQVSIEQIGSFFPNRAISKALWPPIYPDLRCSEFFLWGYWKTGVYKQTYVTTAKGQPFGWNHEHHHRGNTAASHGECNSG